MKIEGNEFVSKDRYVITYEELTETLNYKQQLEVIKKFKSKTGNTKERTDCPFCHNKNTMLLIQLRMVSVGIVFMRHVKLKENTRVKKRWIM